MNKSDLNKIKSFHNLTVWILMAINVILSFLEIVFVAWLHDLGEPILMALIGTVILISAIFFGQTVLLNCYLSNKFLIEEKEQ